MFSSKRRKGEMEKGDVSNLIGSNKEEYSRSKPDREPAEQGRCTRSLQRGERGSHTPPVDSDLIFDI